MSVTCSGHFAEYCQLALSVVVSVLIYRGTLGQTSSPSSEAHNTVNNAGPVPRGKQSLMT